jgi:FAD:protein FMN transferase
LAIERIDDYFSGTFDAMASPCSVLLDTDDRGEAEAALAVAREEAQRIESKFSRYRSGNIVDTINHANGAAVTVDEETASLIDYAVTCYQLSDGMFDITSGVLRRVWKFDGSGRVASPDAIGDCLQHVGWHRVEWSRPSLRLQRGMEIDFGGIGKEYAVDRAAAMIAAHTRSAFVVNFGGDLFVRGPRRGGREWGVGIELTHLRLGVTTAGVATSGDERRYLLWRGKRLGHILNPKTGWPVENAPRSVTVVARTCVEAGTLSTLAYLQGSNAAPYLAEQGVQHWVV